jgi:4a-hydroxytetrahydrobiopterin dehydratase
MSKLDENAIQSALQTVPEWKLDGKVIVRRFKFKSFADSMKFVNQVADIAEARNHHPFISIDYKVVTLKLTSWHAGGLTDADIDEARAFDQLYLTFSS